MKYYIGDILIVKGIFPVRPAWNLRSGSMYLSLVSRFYAVDKPILKNTYGVIVSSELGPYNKDNSYIWYSQVHGEQYHFYQDEVEGEVIK